MTGISPGMHSGVGERFRGVDTPQRPMGNGAAENRSVQLARKVEIADESALPAKEPIVLDALEGAADDCVASGHHDTRASA
jgi:hypothetical protein